MTFDWKSLDSVDLDDRSPAEFCEAAAAGRYRSICDNSETTKKKIQAQVKTITCVYGGKATAKDQRKEPELKELSLKNGKLVWRFNWNAANVNDYAIEFFKKVF